MNNAKPKVLLVVGHGGPNVFDLSVGDIERPKPGEWTRRVAGFVRVELSRAGIDAQVVNPGPVNMPRKSVVGFVNDTSRNASGPFCLIELTTAAEGMVVDADGALSGYSVHVCRQPDRETRRLCFEFQRQLEATGYGIESRGVIEDDSHLMNKTVCPSISFQGGYTTNAGDIENMIKGTEIKRICDAIVATIKTVYDC